MHPFAEAPWAQLTVTFNKVAEIQIQSTSQLWIWIHSGGNWEQFVPKYQDLVSSFNTFINHMEEQDHLCRVLQNSCLVVRHYVLCLRHNNSYVRTECDVNKI